MFSARDWARGNVDYGKIPDLKRVDCEPYRKKGGYRYHWRGHSIDFEWPDPRPLTPPIRFSSLSRQPPLGPHSGKSRERSETCASGR